MRHPDGVGAMAWCIAANARERAFLIWRFSVAWFQGVRNQGYSSVVISSVQP